MLDQTARLHAHLHACTLLVDGGCNVMNQNQKNAFSLNIIRRRVSVNVLVGHLSQSLYGPHAVAAGGHRASEALPASGVESAASQVDCL